VIIVDGRHAGTGSTAASTALLQYEIDKPLHELVHLVGEKNAVRSYLLCREAIFELQKICDKLNDPDLFFTKPSLQYASYEKDVAGLEKEFMLRKKAGIPLRWLEKKDIEQLFGFSKPAGLLSADGAEADAYKITHRIFEKWIPHGLEVYDNTMITGIHYPRDGVELVTAGNRKIRAKKLVIACGYESQRYIPQKVQELQSTYAIASEPFVEKDFWYKNALIWETATPYLYMRTTADKRLIIGGKDVEFSNPRKRDAILLQKARALEKAFGKLFPEIPFKTDFKWAGTFASTKDGLPYIGSINQRPDTYFALGFGGNGITFSLLAARIIRDMIGGKVNRDAEIFSFSR